MSYYLLRIDDVCPTMHRANMAALEETLNELEIRPIVGVVPDNRSPTLEVDRADPNFWNRTREWQDRGWAIALHGFQHLQLTREPGIVRLNKRSEFAGLPFREQCSRIKKGLAIFEAQGLTAKLWMAPSCSFDETTLAALREAGITTISEGLAIWPFVDAHGTFWIPQQLWRFRPVPAGVWTVSIHLNYMTADEINSLDTTLRKRVTQITDVNTIVSAFSNRRKNLVDRIALPILRSAVKVRRAALT